MSAGVSSRPRRISSGIVALTWSAVGSSWPTGPVANCHARSVRKHSSAPPRSGSSSTTSQPSPSIVGAERVEHGDLRRARWRRRRGHATRPPAVGGRAGPVGRAARSGGASGRERRARRARRAAARRRRRCAPSDPRADGDPGVAGADPRHDARRRAEADDVVPRRRVAQRAAHVAAVGDGDHPACQRDGGAAARPAGRAVEVPRVAGHAVDRVERVRAGARARACSSCRPPPRRRPHAGDEQAVGGRAEPGEQRRAVGRREVSGLGEVLVGGDQPGQRAGVVAAGDRLVDGPRPVAARRRDRGR